MKILAIDGNSIINRAFYGIKLLSTKNGLYTNGIYGFVNILFKLLERENPDGVVVAFDLHAPTFRHKQYADYKAGRKSMPEELRAQFPYLKNIITAMGYTCLELEGYEADDILGTISKICEDTDNKCVIATGDRDSFQLVSDNTSVLLSSTKMGKPEINEYTPEIIMEKYGVTPAGMIEIKALQGDASDNIPGVKGIGEKTAGGLIAEFGSIDYIYANLENLNIKDSIKSKLEADKESAFLSKELGTICKTVPISQNPTDYLTKDKCDAELSKIFVELELYSFIQKLNLNVAAVNLDSEKKSKNIEYVDFIEIKDINSCDVYFKREENISIIVFEEKYTVLNLTEKEQYNVFCDILSSDCKKRVFYSKPLYKWGHENSISVNNIGFDCVLAAYLINPSSSSYEIERLTAEYNISSNVDFENQNEYIASVLSQVCDKLKNENDKLNQTELLNNIEIPLSKVLSEMEAIGFKVDKKGIFDYGVELSKRVEVLKKQIFDYVGYEFNINSPKQLGVALFEGLNLPCKKKTKSGYSTNAEVLEELRSYHPVIDCLLEYRTLTKLISTYCEGLVSAADDTGRIHSTLNQTETRTGRISSTDPNLQNIPIKRMEGKELRKYFTAKDGYVLCDADYSQIELRVLAHIAQDEAMINAFKENVDIHSLTASQVFNMPIDMVTPLMRSRAKAVNFGIVYGIGAFSLSKDIGVTRKEADLYIKGYLATYPNVDKYMKDVVEKAKDDGYVKTIFDRRRLLPELKNSNAMLRSFGERVARNMPIQGTAADIIKMAMIKVSNRFEKELPSAKIIMQVHDELIVEAPVENADLACKILKEEMENVVSLSVPLIVDVGYGETWFSAKG